MRLFVMFMQDDNEQPKLEEKQRIQAYMVTSNPTWGNMSAMTLVGRHKGDVIAHDLCWTVICKAWKKGYNFFKASCYVAFQ